jgi:hypothetical protein
MGLCSRLDAVQKTSHTIQYRSLHFPLFSLRLTELGEPPPHRWYSKRKSPLYDPSVARCFQIP